MSTIQNPQSDAENNKETSGFTKPIPKKSKKSPTAFRTISEVADELGVQQHVLRFWETKFSQVKPLKRGGGRRYYRPEDVALLNKIHNLLYTEGYTIKGVQKLLKGQGKQQIIAGGTVSSATTTSALVANELTPSEFSPKAGSLVESEGLSGKQRSILEAMLGDLKELRDMVKGED